MKYFCATCQRKYDIGDIAADFYNICAPEIIENINALSMKWTDEEQSIKDNYMYRLFYFCQNEYEFAGKYFTIRVNEAEQRLVQPRKEDLIVRGKLVLTLGWLINVYKQSGAWLQDAEDNDALRSDPVKVFSGEIGTVIYSKSIQLYFGEVGKAKERVLDHYQDCYNDPFSANDGSGILRGFHRCCPHCGRKLPVAVGRAPEVVIALAGIGRAGKTSGLVAMASGLKSGKYQKFGLSMDSFSNDPQWDALKKQIEFYEKGYKVEKTDTRQDYAPSYSMLISVGKTKRVLTFVDMPGEFWGNENAAGLNREFFTQYSGLYESIDCIWFYISKLIAYGINLGTDTHRTELQQALVDEASELSGAEKILSPDNLNANLRLLSELLAARGRKMPPCAVILTKSEVDVSDKDSIAEFSLFPMEGGKKASPAAISSTNANELKRVFVPDGEGNYHLGESDFFSFSVKVRNFFAKASPGILKAFEENMKYRFYIASSFYGHRAIDDRDHMDSYPPTPYHEMFPLLWTMAITAAIPVRHSCIWNKKNLLGAFKASDEGSESPTFNASAYLYEKPFAGSMKLDPADLKLLYQDIAANLLMENQNVNRALYKQTVFYHKRK